MIRNYYAIDSLERQGTEYALFIAPCRTILYNRRTLSNFRAALATGRYWPGAEQQELLPGQKKTGTQPVPDDCRKVMFTVIPPFW